MCGLKCVQEGCGLMRVVIAGVGRSGWVALMRAQLGVEDGRDVVSVPYAMPVEPLCVGAFIGHSWSLGTTAIGCVTRVHDGEIWVLVPGSTAPKDSGVRSAATETAHYDEW
jgi:hypothetical protein